MTDAASGALSTGRRADFDVHLLHCAACREALHRVETLVKSIDCGLGASVAAEPSPHLVDGIRQAIAEEPNRVWQWWPRSAWLTAAGMCAALAVCFLVVRTSRNTHQPAPHYASHPVSTSSAPNRAAVTSDPAPSPRKLAFSAHGHSARAHRLQIAEPKIIVEPGQMQVILRFAAAMQRRQLDGVKLLAREQESDTPLQIKPLTITPLRIIALKGESESAISETGQDETRNFVGGQSK